MKSAEGHSSSHASTSASYARTPATQILACNECSLARFAVNLAERAATADECITNQFLGQYVGVVCIALQRGMRCG